MLRTTFPLRQASSTSTARSRLFPLASSTSSSSSSSLSFSSSASSSSENQNSGISFENQERNCGMLFTLSSLQQHHNNRQRQQQTTLGGKTASSKEVISTSSRTKRLNAAIKAHSADWQVNEICGQNFNQNDKNHHLLASSSSSSSSSSSFFLPSPVALTKMPKGRWRKLSGRITKKVEVDSSVPFADPGKEYRDMNVSMGSYSYRKGKIPLDRDLLEFSLYRENTPLSAVARRMRRKLHLSRKQQESLRLDSVSESFGCVTQLGHVQKVSAEVLPHASRLYNINPLILNPLKFISSDDDPDSTFSAGPIAKRWRVMLRCVEGESEDEIAETLTDVFQKTGAINYFPLRCFGIDNAAVAMSCAEGSKRYFDACRTWLQNEARRDFLFQPHYNKYLAADSGSIGGILDVAVDDLRDCKGSETLIRVLDFLRKYGRGRHHHGGGNELSETACEELWKEHIHSGRKKDDESNIYREASRSFLWNLAASQRLVNFGARVVEGDFVIVNSEEQEQQENFIVHRVTAEEVRQGKFSVYDLVVPFYQKDDPSDFYNAAIEKFGLPSSDIINNNNNNLNNNNEISKNYRKLLLKPLSSSYSSSSSSSSFSFKIVTDPNSLSLLKTDLFLRQERKLPNETSLEERFREPTPFNVSESFREKMNPVIHLSSSANGTGGVKKRRGYRSVAVECDLPSDSHILSLLREGFDMRHVHFNDMMEIVSPT